MVKKILAPVDGSGHSKKALELACDLASKYDAKLHILHVSLSPSAKHTLVLGGATITVDASSEEIEEAGRKVMDSAKQVAVEHGCKNPETEIQGGPAAQRILESAKENSVDMIVMGSRGLSDIAGLLVGSVSHKVSHVSECTVVTVH